MFKIRPSIFVSHSTKNADDERALEAVRNALGNDYEPLLDRLRMDAAAGRRFDRELAKWLMRCDGGVVIRTLSAASSDWCAYEELVLQTRTESKTFRLLIIDLTEGQDVEGTKFVQNMRDLLEGGRLHILKREEVNEDEVRAFFADLPRFSSSDDQILQAKWMVAAHLNDVASRHLIQPGRAIGLGFELEAEYPDTLRRCFVDHLFAATEAQQIKDAVSTLPVNDEIKRDIMRWVAPALLEPEPKGRIRAAADLPSPERKVELAIGEPAIAEAVVRRDFGVPPDVTDLVTGKSWSLARRARWLPDMAPEFNDLVLDLIAEGGSRVRLTSEENLEAALVKRLQHRLKKRIALVALAPQGKDEASRKVIERCTQTYSGILYCFYGDRGDIRYSSRSDGDEDDLAMDIEELLGEAS